MPVISVKALASVFDSYSCVVMVSDTTLMSMPAKGFAASMNHCISFSWSARDRVDRATDFLVKEALGFIHARHGQSP